MKSLNEQFELIRQSPTVAMADRVSTLKSKGKPIIGLQTGDPDFPTPAAIIKTALEAIHSGQTHYGPSRGFPELRFAAAQKLNRDNGLSYDFEHEIMVTHGGIHAYYLALQSLINPGDEVLVPDPTWATHANMVTMLRGKAVRVPAPPENGFLPQISEWEKYITSRTKVIVINYPSNPTGVYPSMEYMRNLQELASKYNLWVVSDEVYENLFFGDHPVSAGGVGNSHERTILIHSLSKTYAMTGWRVGFLAAPEAVIGNALKASQNSITCVVPFIQRAAAFALSDPGIQLEAAKMRSGYARRRELVLDLVQELNPQKVKVIPPMGAFYYFLDLRALKMPSLEICEQILEKELVGLVPGSAFGNCGEGFVRMTIAASDDEIRTGFAKIIDWAENQK